MVAACVHGCRVGVVTLRRSRNSEQTPIASSMSRRCDRHGLHEPLRDRIDVVRARRGIACSFPHGTPRVVHARCGHGATKRRITSLFATGARYIVTTPLRWLASLAAAAENVAKCEARTFFAIIADQKREGYANSTNTPVSLMVHKYLFLGSH